MTVCNMSIEAGARAGHDRARRQDVRVPRGPARRAAGADWERALDAGASSAPTTTRRSTRRSRSTSSALTPQVTWGTNPGMVAPSTASSPTRPTTTTRSSARPSSARSRYMDLAPGTPIDDDRASTASSSARARTRGSRTSAPRRRSSHGRQRRRRRARDGRPGLGEGEAAGRGRRARPTSSSAAGFEWRQAGCSMCLGMNPDILAAGRALRLDLEPQLRGPPGRRRPHASRQPGDGGGGRDRGALHGRAGARR